jgi:N4-gp56 family major capsid protein
MPSQSTTGAGLSTLVLTYYEKVGLERMIPKLRFYEFGDKKPLPAQSGKTVQWYRFASQAAVTTNMTELTVPAQVILSASTITATLIQRGAYARVSDLLIMTAIDPLLEDAATLMGEKAARSVDTFIHSQMGFFVNAAAKRSALTASLTHTGSGARCYSGRIDHGATNDDGFALLHNNARLATSALVSSMTTSGLTVKQIQHGAMWLRANDVSPFDDGLYVGIIHPKMAYSLMTASGWKGWQKYTSPELMYKGEVGQVGGVRFVESSDAPAYQLSGDLFTTAVSGSVFGTIIFGPHAYGVTEISGQGNKQKGYEMFIKQLGSAGTADPVNQAATVGFKITMAARILNKSAGVILVNNLVG